MCQRRARHNRADERRTAPPRRCDDVLEPDRRRRPPVPADQARVARHAAALATHDRGAARCRHERKRGDAAVVAIARERRLPAAGAATRDRARPRRTAARSDRGRRSVPGRVVSARRRARPRYSDARILPLEHRRDGTSRCATVRRGGCACRRALRAPRLPRLRPRPRAEPKHGGAARGMGHRARRLPAARRRHRSLPPGRAR